MDILLVEDDALILNSLAETLARAGYSAAGTATAEAALALVNGDEGPAVLVTDINLGPGMDGLALGRAARARWPNVAIVYISGRYSTLGGLSARERFVAKPFGSAALLRAIDEARLGR